MSNDIVIRAPARRIFERASQTPRWPEILPHYRYVIVLRSDGDKRIVEMAARRPVGRLPFGIPVRWRAEQTDDPALPQIAFVHLGGWTRGMQVYWHFTPLPNGDTHVRIDHELRSPLARIIGKFFIDPIATRTLTRMKEVCEAS